MRLLNTSTLTLHEFYDDNIPEYAILSHTWGEEEVSFHDLQNKTPEQLDGWKGYVKIKACCGVAASERYKYVWIDTCCIDKTSSAELSEAINSMYRWYRNAEVCYAYLVDVWTGEEDKDSRRLVRDLKEYNLQVATDISDFWKRFRRSRWFTRGWTLQELLAPITMWFFDRDWRRLGNKVSLKRKLSSITGIQTFHIFEHTSASAAQKMSWASGRKTTRVEDMAYSLMGIFDVNMPLLYGEGRNAFIRLQHEIVKISDDESIFAWEDGLLRESGMFAQSPKAFANSRDIVQINDLHPLYVSRAPYAVTNRGLAIENFAHGESESIRVSDLDISLLSLNCRRQAQSGTEPIEQRIMIELTETSRDAFLRWSPRLLKPSTCSFNLTSPRLVYIRPIYTSRDSALGPSLHYIDAGSLVKRRLYLAETFDCRTEQDGLRSMLQDEHKWRISDWTDQKFPAILFKSSIFGSPALFGVILQTNGTIIDGIHLIVPSVGQTFLEEMNKYRRTCQPPTETRAFKRLQDGSMVSVVLKRRRLDTELWTHLSNHYSWRYIVEIS